MRFRTVLLATSLCAMAALPAHADDCAAMVNTMLAHVSTPYSATMLTLLPNGQTRTTKTVSTGGMMYIQIDGAWQSMKMDPKGVADAMRKNVATAKQTCHTAGEEVVGGQPSTIYMAHVENQGTVSDNKVWISKAHAQIMKTDIQIKGGQHISMTFDYTNVTPPAGAKPAAK